MATSYNTAKELRLVRKAIREITAGAKSATISSPAGQHSYTSLDLDTLYARERELLARIARGEIRKRVAPDFS